MNSRDDLNFMILVICRTHYYFKILFSPIAITIRILLQNLLAAVFNTYLISVEHAKMVEKTNGAVRLSNTYHSMTRPIEAHWPAWYGGTRKFNGANTPCGKELRACVQVST